MGMEKVVEKASISAPIVSQDAIPPYSARDLGGSLFELTLHNDVVSSGSVISGVIDLDVKVAHEEDVEYFRVTLSGHLYTHIEVQTTQTQNSSTNHNNNTRTNRRVYSENWTVYESSIDLWKRGETYPVIGNTLNLPFQLQVPAGFNTPSFSSNFANGYRDDDYAKVTWTVEALAYRTGFFKRNRSTERLITLVNQDDTGRQIRETLQQLPPNVWNNTWTSLRVEKKIRRHRWQFWTRRCPVDAVVDLPDIPTWPVGARIPIKFEITSYSKPVEESKRDTLAVENMIFPKPATNSRNVKISLVQHSWFMAQHQIAERERKLLPFSGWSDVDNEPVIPAVSVFEPEWVLDADAADKKLGRWKQVTRFEAALEIPALTESFVHKILNVRYEMHIRIGFEDCNSKLRGILPVVISSGV